MGRGVTTTLLLGQTGDNQGSYRSPNVLESYMLSLRNANAGDFSVSRCLTANEEKCAKI